MIVLLSKYQVLRYYGVPETMLQLFLLTQVLYYTEKCFVSSTYGSSNVATSEKTTQLRVAASDEQFGSEPD